MSDQRKKVKASVNGLTENTSSKELDTSSPVPSPAREEGELRAYLENQGAVLRGNEPLSLEKIRSPIARCLPLDGVKGDASILCMMGAGTFGKAELIRLRDEGFKRVTVVDPNHKKVRIVKELFPQEWEYSTSEPDAWIRSEILSKRAFDIVICDGSKAVQDYTWGTLLAQVLLLPVSRYVWKLTEEYLADYDLGLVSDDSVALLLEQLGLNQFVVESIQPRSPGYWVVMRRAKLSGDTPAFERSTRHETPHRENACELRDILGNPPCPNEDTCQQVVDKFRWSVERKQRQSIFRVFTDDHFDQASPMAIARFDKAAAILDLDRFKSMEEVAEAMRITTAKKGKVNRLIKKAVRAGYYVKRFDMRTFIPDLHTIHHSRMIRGGKPLREEYRKSIEELGGEPTEHIEFYEPQCPVHCKTYWGVFLSEEGYKQGSVLTNERLVGYVKLFGAGNHCWYSHVMGHDSHLNDGIMFYLHYKMVEHSLRVRSETGLRYHVYGAWASGPRNGDLTRWKKRSLFEPRFLIYNEAGNWKDLEGMKFFIGNPHNLNDSNKDG